jgi:hypothetical protein
MVQIDRSLADFFYSAKGGSFLHPLSHYVCREPSRERQNREIAGEYLRLEQQYQRLGGTFAPGDEQEIVLEENHRSCAGPAKSAGTLWEKIANNIERELSKVRSLLARKRKLLRMQEAS